MTNCPPGDREYCQSWLTTTHDELHPFYVSLGFKPTGTRFVRHEGTPGASIVIED
jgi:hypothetical protein